MRSLFPKLRRLLAALLLAAWSAGPLLWMTIASLRSSRDLLFEPTRMLPQHITIGAYRALVANPAFLGSLFLSTAIASTSALVSLLIALGASYVLVRYRIPGMGLMRHASLWGHLFPPVILILPYFMMMRWAQLQDSTAALILSHVAYCFPFSMWLLLPFMKNMPRGLEEMAAADGARPIQVLLRVVLPNIRPALLAVASFSFALSWSDYLFARILLSGGRRTLPVFIFDLYTGTFIDWSLLMAAGVVSVLLPALIMFMLHGQSALQTSTHRPRT